MADEKGSGFTPEKAPVKPAIEGTKPPVAETKVTNKLKDGREENPLGTLRVLAEDPDELGKGAEIPEKPSREMGETISPSTSGNEQKAAVNTQAPEQKSPDTPSAIIVHDRQFCEKP